MPVYLASKDRWTKDGRKYYFICYYKDVDGKLKQKYSKLYAGKKEASNEEKKFLILYKNDLIKKIKFDLVSQLYFEDIYKKRKESTGYSYEEDYNRHIKPYFGELYIDSINTQLINEWKLKMENKGYSLKYLNGFYNIISGIFDYAIKNFEIEKNPMKIVGRFERRKDTIVKDDEKLRYIVYEQYIQLISVIDSIMYKSLFAIFYFTGMRKGEVQALTWHDIDFDSNNIIVNKNLSIKTKSKDGYVITPTKNYKNRKVAMNKTLKEILFQYKNEMSNYSDFSENWFVFGATRFLPQTTIDRYKNHYFKLAGLKPITIHEFRHSHVSLLINQYIENCSKNHQEIDTAYFFIMVANRIGDTTDTMTRVYLHLFPSMQKPIINLLDNL